MFSHVVDLSFHGQKKQGKKIQQKNGPKHGHVENFKEGEEDGNGHSFGGGEPGKEKMGDVVEGGEKRQRTRTHEQ
jgi:hypothetical protein